jgi:DNA repair protein RadC
MRLNRDDRRRLMKVLGPEDAASAVQTLVCPEHHEGQVVLALDRSGNVCGGELRCPCERCRNELLADGSELAALAADLGGLEVVLVTFVDDARLEPSTADVAHFEGLRVECASDGVELLDHLLFSGHRWRSVREVSAGLDA